MTPQVYRVEIGETLQEESARLEWQHWIAESVHQSGEVGLIQGLLVLSGPQRTTKRFDRRFGLIVQETNQTVGVIWLGAIIDTVFHLAASHAELDGLKEEELRSALNLMQIESPELYDSVSQSLALPDHTLETRPTAGSGHGRRAKTIFSSEQLSPQSFQSTHEYQQIKGEIKIPAVRRRPIPIDQTVAEDGVSF